MCEARRLLEPQSTQPYLEAARKLLDWLLMRKPEMPTPREILQFSPLRTKELRDNALERLIEHQYIRLIKSGNKTSIDLNPYCH